VDLLILTRFGKITVIATEGVVFDSDPFFAFGDFKKTPILKIARAFFLAASEAAEHKIVAHNAPTARRIARRQTSQNSASRAFGPRSSASRRWQATQQRGAWVCKIFMFEHSVHCSKRQ
jgi:hypothetical protein